jgi:hypothetical protein
MTIMTIIMMKVMITAKVAAAAAEIMIQRDAQDVRDAAYLSICLSRRIQEKL